STAPNGCACCKQSKSGGRRARRAPRSARVSTSGSGRSSEFSGGVAAQQETVPQGEGVPRPAQEKEARQAMAISIEFANDAELQAKSKVVGVGGGGVNGIN